MNQVLVVISLCLVLQQVVAPPRRRGEKEHDEKDQEQLSENDVDEMQSELGIEYVRYLKEVVELLESDDTFKQKLKDADEADIRSGKIAHELDLVDHRVRSKLDEVKRQEMERLRHLAQRQFELSNGIDVEHMKGLSAHLDHDNPHTFETEDLKKLIAKATVDLEENDKKRREDFKEYEMQKEFEKQEKLKHLEGDEKAAFEKEIKENETKHRQHEPLHHPGSRQQLEEVWEKQDHMENQDFDPKVFFQLHDLDGNGVWDQDEVKTLFLKELDKLYQSGAPEDDMRERAEELERMREHVFKEADKNRDSLISFKEFLDQTKKPEFEKDAGWESIDGSHEFTQQEYHEFEARRQAEVQRMIQQGLIPPVPVYPPQGYHPQQFPHQAQYGHPDQAGYNQGYHPNQIPQHHGQILQHHPNQMPQHPNQMPQHPNQMPQHHGQIPQHPNQIPQHPNQIPQHPNQMPQHHGQIPQHPNQIPQHPNQIPQHPNQIPQHPNQIPQQHGQIPQYAQHHPNQVPQHPNQIPQQQHLNQIPQHPNEIPQKQFLHPNQIPQQQIGLNQMPQHPNQVPQQGNQQYQNQIPQQQQPQHNSQVPSNAQLPNQAGQHGDQGSLDNQAAPNPNSQYVGASHDTQDSVAHKEESSNSAKH